MRWDDIDKQVCSVARALSVVGERWTLLILRDLLWRGPHGYQQLLDANPGLSPTVLAERLRRLRASRRHVLVCGDFNIAHKEIDLKNWRGNRKNSGFLPDERAWMDKFLGRRIRHLLIEENGKYIGMLSGGDVMKCVIHEKDAELKQLNSMVSWDYYEDWKWKP